MFVFLQSKLKYFPKIFIFEQGVLFVKLSFVNIMVRKIICSEISAITVTDLDNFFAFSSQSDGLTTMRSEF